MENNIEMKNVFQAHHVKKFELSPTPLEVALKNRNPEVRCLYTLGQILVYIYVLRCFGNYYFNYHLFRKHLDYIARTMDDVPHMIVTIAWMDIIGIAVFFAITHLGIYLRQRVQSVSTVNWILSFAFIVGVVLYFQYTYHLLVECRFKMLSAAFATVEQVRILLKSFVYFSESFTLETMKTNPLWTQLKKFTYYIYAPTLIYRDEYPRNARIRPLYLFKYVIHMIFITITAGNLLFIFIMDNYSCDNISVAHVFNTFPELLFRATIAFILLFYWENDCYLQIWAEVLRFGDRRFYGHFWRQQTSLKFLREHNLFVSDFLLYYIQIPMKCVCGNEFIVKSFIIIMSFIFHDYVVSFMMGFSVPPYFLYNALYVGALLQIPFLRVKSLNKYFGMGSHVTAFAIYTMALVIHYNTNENICNLSLHSNE